MEDHRVRAVIFDEFGAQPRVAEVDEPVVAADGALIRVTATGLCRSDWHGWSGHDDTVRVPHVPGHEFAGTVVSVGSSVRDWYGGERVTVPFVCGCGSCEWCLAGQMQVCPNQTQPGFTQWGSFAQYVAVRFADTNLVAVPDSVSDQAAASLGCRFATAYHALTSRARLAAGEWIAVFGCGGVGLSAIMIAHALGARVLAIDRSSAALSLATNLGADRTALADDVTPALIDQLTGGGAHVSVDAVGSPQTSADAIASLRRRGRHVQIGLIAGGRVELPMDRIIGWELDVLGSHGMPSSDYPDLLELVSSGALRPDELIGRTVGLEEAAALLPGWTPDDGAGMILIDPAR
jgi:alcohol dehydrogenase